MGPSELGQALKKLRESKGLDAADVARRARFGQAIIDRTEAGAQYPSMKSLVAWLEVFGTTPGAFLADLEQDHLAEDIRIVPAYESYYRLLTEILDSHQTLYIDGIRASLIAMAAQTRQEKEKPETKQESGNLIPKEKRKPDRKVRPASSSN